MFVLLLLRTRYGPPIIILAGIALMVVGVTVTHHVVTGIIGAALVIIGTAPAVTRKKRGGLSRGRDDGLGRMIQSTDIADDVRAGSAGVGR